MQDKIAKLPNWAQEHIAEVEHDARIAAAFHRTEPVELDVDIPKTSSDLARGWLFNTYDSGSVSRACSSSVSHCSRGDEKTTTQRPRRLYSTKLRALRALRYAVEQEAAKKLANIDKMISDEMSESGKG